MNPRRHLAHEGGFTMAAVMMGLLLVMSLSVAAFSAAGGDLRGGQRNVEAKRAYAAAEAGIAYYLQKLSQDNDYWTKCTTDDQANPNPVNQPWYGAPGTPDPRIWRALPGDPAAEARPAEFSIELLARSTTTPPTATPECIVGNNESMLDPMSGTLKIRSTGRSGPAGREVRRTVVATLRRKGFLDFLYFTNFETSDPAQQVISSYTNLWKTTSLAAVPAAQAATAPADSIAQWADRPEGCRQWTRGGPGLVGGVRSPGRNTSGYQYSGYYDPPGTQPLGWYLTSERGAFNIACSRIQFAPTDAVAGPFHSNDTILVCGNPTFGRDGRNDAVEYWDTADACADSSPSFASSTIVRTGNDAGVIPLPSTNTALQSTTYSRYRFEGKTVITLNGTTMSVSEDGAAAVNMPLPPNGLIYVDNKPSPGCPVTDPADPYANLPGCGDVVLNGSYSKSLTIASKHDIRISGNVTRTTGSDALLGLIADGFVRIEHRVATQSCDSGTANVPAGTQPRTVEAAILSLNRVFTVDNYQCGEKLGDLTIRGAIAQNYRGPVGTSGSGGTGYIKRYEYDQRLKFRSPPYFLSPVDSAWQALRTTEQSPAR